MKAEIAEVFIILFISELFNSYWYMKRKLTVLYHHPIVCLKGKRSILLL